MPGLLAFSAALGVATQASADLSQQTPEIIVTGERTPRTIAETPSSVVVITIDEIEATGADRLDQMLARTPNIQVGSGEEGPAVRGQDSTGVLRNLFAFLGGTRPRVTLQIDGRPANYYEYVTSVAPMWDVDRIEVFRSPQTTTQGRNSIAGAIFIETAQPTFEWQGRARAIWGEGDTGQFSAALSGPLLADQIAFRASGDVRTSTTSTDMADGIPNADIDLDEYASARLKVAITPAAIPGLRIETGYSHLRSQSPQFESVRRPFEERANPRFERTNGVHRVVSDALSTRVEYDPDSALSGSLTFAYADALIRRLSLPGLGTTRVEARDVSGEAILRWKPAPAFSLLFGTHLLGTELEQTIDITGLFIGKGGFRDEQSSLGLFSEANWRPLSELSITAGLRYQRDRQDRDGLVGPQPSGIFLDYDETFDAWLPKFSVALDVTPDLTAGILVQKASNPGGTSISLRTRRQDSFEAETLWNYEGFARLKFAGGKGHIAANIFRNDLRNAQRQLLVSIPLPDGTSFETLEYANAPRARISGLELQLDWKLDDTLSIWAGVGFLRTRMTETVLAGDRSLGKEFQRAPHFSGSWGVEWKPTAKVRLSTTGRHHSGYFSDDANDPRLVIDGTTIFDLRGAYSLGNATVFAYALNLFDTFYLNYLFDPEFGAAGDPREVGVGIEARF